MKRTPRCGLFFIASLLVLAIPAALASTVVVGTCLQGHQTYSTIAQAVSSVPSGSTVLVCPGVYQSK